LLGIRVETIIQHFQNQNSWKSGQQLLRSIADSPQKKQTKEKQKNILINPLHRKDTFGNNKPKTWAGSE